MADESSADPRGLHFLKVSSDHHLFFFHLIRRIAIPIMAITIMALEKLLPAWSSSLEWWSWLRKSSLRLLFSRHIWVNWLWSHCSLRGGWVNYGWDLHWSKHGGGWGKAELPEWADYGNASTDRLKGCASEAEERSNKSSILPLLAVKCLRFLSMTKTGRLGQNTKQQLCTNTSKVPTLHKKLGDYFLFH